MVFHTLAHAHVLISQRFRRNFCDGKLNNTLVATCIVLSPKDFDEPATCTTLVHTNFFATNWKHLFVSIYGACIPEVILALLCAMCTKYCHNNLSHFSPSIINFIVADTDLPLIGQIYKFAYRDQRDKWLFNNSAWMHVWTDHLDAINYLLK